MVFTPPIVNVELRSKDEDEAGYSMALPGGCKFTQRRRRYLKGPSILIGDTACASQIWTSSDSTETLYTAYDRKNAHIVVKGHVNSKQEVGRMVIDAGNREKCVVCLPTGSGSKNVGSLKELLVIKSMFARRTRVFKHEGAQFEWTSVPVNEFWPDHGSYYLLTKKGSREVLASTERLDTRGQDDSRAFEPLYFVDSVLPMLDAVIVSLSLISHSTVGL